MQNSNLREIYDKLSEVAIVPDYTTFEQKYSSEKGFQELYYKIQKANIKVPDYNTFKKKYYVPIGSKIELNNSSIKKSGFIPTKEQGIPVNATNNKNTITLTDSKATNYSKLVTTYNSLSNTNINVYILLSILSIITLKFVLNKINPNKKNSFLQLTIVESFSRIKLLINEFIKSITKTINETPLYKILWYLILVPILPLYVFLYIIGFIEGYKNKTTRIKSILYSIIILFLPIFVYSSWILYNTGFSLKKESTDNVLSVDQKPSTNKTEIKIDTTTLYGKLDYDLMNGNYSIFNYTDNDNYFNTNVKVKYSNRMIIAKGDKKRTIVKFGIMDGKEQFRCVINFQPTNTRELTTEEKKQLLTKESATETLNTLKEYYNKLDILDITENINVANQFCTSYEYYIVSNLGGYNYHVARQYSFYYKGGNGSIQFYMDSNNDNEEFLVNKFRKYNSVINRITNSLELEENY